MIYGIPGFKLEKHVVERRNELLADGGVRIRAELPMSARISALTPSAASMTQC